MILVFEQAGQDLHQEDFQGRCRYRPSERDKTFQELNFQVFNKSDDLEEDGWISAVGEEDEEFGGGQVKPKTKKEEFGRSQVKAPKSQIKADATSNKVLPQIYIYQKSLIFLFFHNMTQVGRVLVSWNWFKLV